MCQVINTQTLKANIAIDHKLFQSCTAISWLSKLELKVITVELNGAVPELIINRPAVELGLHKKSYTLKDESKITYLFDLIILGSKVARIKWYEEYSTEQKELH